MEPADFALLEMQFGGAIYVDKVLPMRYSIPCALFETFKTFMQWLFTQKSGPKLVCHYLDDVRFVGEKDIGQCLKAIQNFQSVVEDMGVPLAPERT